MIVPVRLEHGFKAHTFESSQEDYHKIQDAVHSSQLIHMIDGPHAYAFFKKNPKKKTEAMHFGTMAHEATLEGKKFLERYVVQPVFKGLTLEGKETTSMNSKHVREQYEAWLESLPKNALIMTQDEHDRLRFMMDSLLNHKFVADILKDGIPEHKKMWRDPVTGFKCVSSDDFVSFKNDVWVDIKTTTDSNWYSFRRTVEQLRYDFQCAFYARGNKETYGNSLEDKVWIALESQAPYGCRVHYVDPYYQSSGEAAVKKAMLDLSHCVKHEAWNQTQMIIESGEPSVWFKNEQDIKIEESERE